MSFEKANSIVKEQKDELKFDSGNEQEFKEKGGLFRFFTKKEIKEKEPEPEKVPLLKLFRFATWIDLILIFLGIIFSIATGIAQPLMGVAFGSMIESIGMINQSGVSSAAAHDSLTQSVLIFVYFGVGLTICAYGSMCTLTLAGERQSKRIREIYLHSILRQDLSWFDTNEAESLTVRLSESTFLIQEGLSDKAGHLLQNSAQFVAGFIMAFVFSWRLTLVLLAFMPLLAISGFLLNKILTRGTSAEQDAYSGAGAVLEQAVSGIRTVASFSMQSRFIKQYEKKLEIAFNAGLKKAIAIGFWYGSHLVTQGVMGSNELLSAFFALLIGSFSIGQIPPNYKAIVEAQAAASKIFATIDRVPAIDTSPDDQHRGKVPDSCAGSIVLRGVHFHYPSRKEVQILRNVDLEIPSGKTVALVGASGSGKSTIIQLVQRFYDPTQGTVLLDGVPLKELSVKWLRQQIGLVGQEPVLFNDTIRNNISLGALGRNPTEEEIIKACKQANCHDLIMKLPQGYDTHVGEKGSQLSGGQKQRIAIARALIRKPAILLLDEATSALDTHSERLVQEALRSAAVNRSTIVIAHRLSTIRDADLIVVMDHGTIVEQGTHDELIAKRGAYAHFVAEQQLKSESDGDESSDPVGEKEEDVKKPVEVEEGPPLKNTLSLDRPLTGGGSNNAELAELRASFGDTGVPKEKHPALRTLRMMRPDLLLLIISVISSGIAGAINPVYAIVYARMLEALVQPPALVEDASRIWAIAFVILGVANFIGSIGKEGLMLYLGERLVQRVRSLCFRNLMRQEMAFFDHPEHSTGQLASLLSKEITKMQGLPNNMYMDFGKIFFSLVIGLGIAFSNGWKLTLVILATVPIVVSTSIYELKALEGFSIKSRKEILKSGQIVGEAIAEIRTVASLTIEDLFEIKYSDANKAPHREALKKAYLASIGYGLSQGFSFLVSGLGFYVGVRFMESGEYTSSQVFGVLFPVLFTSTGLGHLSAKIPRITQGREAAVMIFALLDKCTTIDPKANGDTSGPEPDSAELRNVTFAYPSRRETTIFDGLSMQIKEKQKVALVGPSGCGKSTVIALLMRWYDTHSGEVYIEGTDVRNWQLVAMRSRIALVGQEPVLFDLTVRENILYGSEDGIETTQEEIEEAARCANAHDFISQLPNGYHTRVGDRGSQLSGGQKQRIAIARALIRKPHILLLDEATSALDSESEKLVQVTLDNAMEGRTTIAIAHRLSSIQDSDLILVFKNGFIVEQGSHLELLAQSGLYCELAKQQDLAAVVDQI
ncbi:uncharacterized protein VTP21DRAFT_3223 [Calcarisporiella thermophila]|uniref:uncharacterized protein n=1 Tax=Calcarisporiella thermophila TaxID=911321 RepID=UPI00374422F8